MSRHHNADATNAQLVMLIDSCRNLEASLRKVRNEGTLNDKADDTLREAEKALYKAYDLMDIGRSWNLPGMYKKTE